MNTCSAKLWRAGQDGFVIINSEVLKLICSAISDSITFPVGSQILVSQATPFNLREKEGLVTSHT